MQEIPLLPIPNQELLVILDDQECTLHVYQRGQRIFLDLFLDGEELRRGAICLPRLNIPAQPWPFEGSLYFTDELAPPAMQAPPHYTGLGDRFHLYYLTAEETAEVNGIIEEAALNG